jgi:hypothetical protein
LQRAPKLKRLARHLLTTTCLTAGVAGCAYATGLNVTGLSPSTNESSPTIETVGTGANSVSGTTNEGSNYIEFEGLPAGSTLGSISFVFTNNSSFSEYSLTILNSSDTVLSGPVGVPAGGSDTPSSVVIPSNGDIVVDFGECECSSGFTITLNDPSSVPEPAALGGVGLGLAGIGALARRRRKQN